VDTQGAVNGWNQCAVQLVGFRGDETANFDFPLMTEVHALYQNEFYVHDPRFDLEDNTLSAPLQDGGGAILEETKSSVFHHSSSCANVPRSFLNEEFCFMSTRLDACGDLQSPGITGEFGKYVH
jgi:hypothetical protein